MSQIKKKFVGSNQIDGSKIRLANNENLKARNAADSADVSLLKVNASDRIEFASLPQVTSDPAAANDLVRKSYADGLSGVWAKETLTLAGGDITNQYIDLAQEITTGSLSLSIDGVLLWEGASYDYTLSLASGVTRITFLNDIATGGNAALVAGDVLRAHYQY